MPMKSIGKTLAVAWGTRIHEGKVVNVSHSFSAVTSDSLPRWPILSTGINRLKGIGDTIHVWLVVKGPTGK